MATRAQLDWGRGGSSARSGSGRAFAWGAGAGWLAGYLLDRDRGRQRRAVLRDKALRLRRDAAHLVEVVRRDARQRGQGLAARARTRVRRGPVDDEVLLGRIRAELGRRVSHPHAIEVRVVDGCVTLEGAIPSREVQPLVRRLRRFPGVHALLNRLAVHTHDENVPELAGGATHRRVHPLARSWPPAARVVAGAAGGTFWLLGVPRRTPGYWAGTLGAMLLWRALANPHPHREPLATRAAGNGARRAPVGEPEHAL